MAPPEAADEVALGFIHITMAAQRAAVPRCRKAPAESVLHAWRKARLGYPRCRGVPPPRQTASSDRSNRRRARSLGKRTVAIAPGHRRPPRSAVHHGHLSV